MSRIVVKVGTSTLVYPSFGLNIRHVERLVKILSDLQNAGNEMILVSSGAIAMGVNKLRFAKRPTSVVEKQAYASVGQCELMYTYDRLFEGYGETVSQILITGDDMASEEKVASFQATIEYLIHHSVIPIINENDTMNAAEIISIGDNDTLAAIVACHCHADLLVLYSDIDGLYTADPNKDPNATLIHEVHGITEDIEKLGGDSISGQGTGGMVTKLHAANMCSKSGIDMAILNGSTPELIYDLLEGKPAGTLFLAQGK